MPIPIRIPSRGPNGTHWPELFTTPHPSDTATNEIVVDCTAAAIIAAVSAITPTLAAQSTIIRVRPGTIMGTGYGASQTPLFSALGNLSWTKRITICPLDGWGTVKIVNARWADCFKIAWVGFDLDGFNFTHCTAGALVWSRSVGRQANFYSDNDLTTEDFEIVEVVFGTTAITDTADRCDFYVGGSGGRLRNFRIDGCYFAPKWRRAGVLPAPHCDTIQFGLGSGGAEYPTGFVFRDTAAFASQTTVFQRCDYATFDNVFACGGVPNRNRYPYTEGSDSSGGNYVFNGWGYYNTAANCDFVGVHKFTNSDAPHWQSVTNTRVSTNFRGSAPVSGAWTVDGALDDPTLPQIPTAALLATMWNWRGGIPYVPPDDSPEAPKPEPEGLPLWPKRARRRRR